MVTEHDQDWWDDRFARADKELTRSVVVLRSLIDLLAQNIDVLSKGGVPPRGEERKKLSELQSAYRDVHDAESRIVKLVKDYAGDDAPLDLDALREEVLGRLDRLRRATEE